MSHVLFNSSHKVEYLNKEHTFIYWSTYCGGITVDIHAVPVVKKRRKAKVKHHAYI